MPPDVINQDYTLKYGRNGKELMGDKKANHKPAGARSWSKLGRDIRALFDPNLPLQIHCVAYALNSKEARGSTRLPRYWITLGKEIIFDFPKQFLETVIEEPSDRMKKRLGEEAGMLKHLYPFYQDRGVSDISDFLREYIERPKEALTEPFENDYWGLSEILRAADRRVGKRKLREMNPENPGARKIIFLRLNQKKVNEKRTDP